ncbi:MAG: RNA polymerase sigma factor [Proteobacteria bacterium]|nr:RNA polymerase sigma factor [Pseudomonadota bacterium]
MTDKNNQDDSRLVKRCQKRDKRALEHLYARHHGVLYAMALRMTGQVADAEDIVQESFIRAWKALPNFRGETTFRNWLLRIGINLCRNMHKRKKETVKLQDIPAPANDSDTLARNWLEKALSKLPDGYREVLVLHDVMDLRHVEIAEVLGLSVGTSKSQLHRARIKMRDLLITKRNAGDSLHTAKMRRYR